MFIVQILVVFLIGYIVGFWQNYSKLKRKKRKCSNKKQMIENRDELIGKQEIKIKELQHNSLIYEQIKEIYRTERKIVDRHDKIKELIDKDN